MDSQIASREIAGHIEADSIIAEALISALGNDLSLDDDWELDVTILSEFDV